MERAPVVDSAGSGTHDRTCMPCPDGMWSNASNATQCKPLTQCAPGSYVRTQPSTSRDRVCAACASGTFSTSRSGGQLQRGLRGDRECV